MVFDALALAQAFAQGQADPVGTLEAALLRAFAAPEVFIETTVERARREARAAHERLIAGQPLSVLDGVPIAWKDLFDMRGTRTTAGAQVRRQGEPALRDAALVNTLTRAGLVNLGKTNLSELAYSGLGLNPHFGTPSLPCGDQPTRAPGGSSSGSAIAVATGIVPLAMGTDTAGSIRIPAAFNGLIGYRASRQRYAMQGVFPLARSLDALGPLAHSVRDVLALDQLLSGAQTSPPLPLPGLRLRVDTAVLRDPRVEPAVRNNLMAALERLRTAGVLVEQRPVAALQACLALIEKHGWLGSAEAFTLHQHLLDGPEAERLDPRVRKRLEAARHVPASTQLMLSQAAEDLREQLRDELNGALLVTPTVGHVAPPLGPLLEDDELFARTNLATLRLTMPGSLLDMPGVAMPSGKDNQGLHTSLLLAAPSGQDTDLLRAALAIEPLVRNH
ncbi:MULTISPECIES: amidase [unclassified Pseudomonas]|uniref:amidase n=1 Tax=unclassified Pseudomonas TaxID=196821 RepID=UPI000BC51CA5|nr:MULTISPECIES: amidase [unclassified Pseudomonas]PVZ19563.1 aspartyl-tRNA(Asn)/glutamyl-tRNA(Gln) amidotransferase subunit A [Pseudomonas sp. URIL14HWK12:I12]PVZ22852.1 aspartyl-tRNA(Asn)/glutamyl-tRNA(Gln) amidotransferase subunit A [Pseudomonas sp. URIL14HWK12:I10]PVZ37518.1 aspartyl-tRNA(Asn)/glutamyl-tRNA(Gln) amidotransferase subunit A [Pseudomonas sp. URIL14HWK12:I11]SNZ14983.1 aspartyl-tRNA(Asn)/glutamyl-tRNA(Gln) amidotransferase subunit A [Pseudomonas sp. URIL14HWK12:I9]